MSRKIIGVTVGTPMNPQVILEKTKVPEDIGKLSKSIDDHKSDSASHVTQTEKETWNGKAEKNDIPTKTSQLTNNSGFATEAYVQNHAQPKGNYLTEHQDISGKADKSTTLAGYGITDGATKQEVNQLSETIVDKVTIQDMIDNKFDTIVDGNGVSY